MKYIIKTFLLGILLAGLVVAVMPARVYAAPGGNCKPADSKTDLLGLPAWYEYLDGREDDNGRCVPQLSSVTPTETTIGIRLESIWLIALALLELLLRLAGMIAVGVVIYGGIKFITSQGSPDATKAARNIIINAMVGIFISILAAVSVNYIASSLIK